MKKLYYLGPQGTYSELAALKIKNLLQDVEMKEVTTIAKVIEIVHFNDDCIGVLPIENLIDGKVRQTLDNIYATDVKIQAQFDLDIVHCLLSKSCDIKSVQHIVSHPQALAQCQRFILNNFDENIDINCVSSTAHAARTLEKKDETYAAISSIRLAKELNLNILAENIGDVKENKTRFVVISNKNLHLGKNAQTSIVFNTKNRPGALLKILDIFSKNGVNLVHLESRPSKDVFGEYNFFTDIDKGIEDLQFVLDKIAWECNFYKLLGSYPML